MIYTPVKKENGDIENIIFFKDILLNSLPVGFRTDVSLDFEGSSIKELPLGLIVRGNLYLKNSLIKEIPEDIIVCGNIYGANNEVIIPNDLIVGGIIENHEEKKHNFKENEQTDKYVYCNNILIPYKNIKKLKGLITEENNNINDNKQKEFDYFNGIFKDLNALKENDNKYFICDSVKQALICIKYIEAVDRGLNRFLNYNKDSLVTIPEAAEIYEVCTGACKNGIDEFINNLTDKKELYSLDEVAKMTKGKYHGGDIIFQNLVYGIKI